MKNEPSRSAGIRGVKPSNKGLWVRLQILVNKIAIPG
jgi:hypothetical protein